MRILPIVFLSFLSILAIRVKAQYVGLSPKEMLHLSALLKKNETVKKYYHSFQTTADAALQQDPDPVDTIISEGHLVTDPKKIRTIQALRDFNKIYALSLVYRISNQKKYLSKCIAYLQAWATVNRGAGNPINDTKLDPLLEAYDMIKEETPPGQRKIIDDWLTQIATAEINNPRFQSTRKSVYNNWNSHRIKVVGLIAWILNNKKFKHFTDTCFQTQVLKNLYADGSGMDFEDRDALHYHIYTLEPLLSVAKLMQRAKGRDIYRYRSSTGSSVQHSLDFLVPFVTGEKKHAEFVNSHVSFDRKRADNHEAGYQIGAKFEPSTAIGVLSQATYFEPRFLKMVQSLLHTEDPYPNWEVLVNSLE